MKNKLSQRMSFIKQLKKVVGINDGTEETNKHTYRGLCGLCDRYHSGKCKENEKKDTR